MEIGLTLSMTPSFTIFFLLIFHFLITFFTIFFFNTISLGHLSLFFFLFFVFTLIFLSIFNYFPFSGQFSVSYVIIIFLEISVKFRTFADQILEDHRRFTPQLTLKIFWQIFFNFECEICDRDDFPTLRDRHERWEIEWDVISDACAVHLF